MIANALVTAGLLLSYTIVYLLLNGGWYFMKDSSDRQMGENFNQHF